MAAAQFSNAVGAAVTTATPVPAVSNIAGWAVSESIKWLITQARAVKDYPEDCRQLLVLLEDARLHTAVEALDKLTDHPDFQMHRTAYQEFCSHLEEANIELRSAPASTAAPVECSPLPPGPEHDEGVDAMASSHSCMRFRGKAESLPRRIVHRSKAQELADALRQFCELQDYQELYRTLKTLPQPRAPPPLLPQRLTSLHDRCGPSPSTANCGEPRLLKHVFQHHDDLVPRVEDLLVTTRNVALVGMGGIGKTTVARAVFDRSESKFNALVWLTVGGDVTDSHMLPLLRTAFSELYPGKADSFEDAEQALQDLVNRLTVDGRSVLLVLDDVWPSTKHGVVAALNFATRCVSRHADSRLLVTTRQRGVLSYSPHQIPPPEMDELHVQAVEPLRKEHAQELFHHHAFGASNAQPPEFLPCEVCVELIEECGGNPLALKVLAGAVATTRGSSESSAAEWKRRLADFRKQQDEGQDRVTQVCAVSVATLPPSLLECFVDFAAFQEDERVPEADLVHLFATHAPVHTPHSLQAATQKLQELVQRSLVSVESINDWDKYVVPGLDRAFSGPWYYMHDVLRSLALREARMGSRGRCFHLHEIGQHSDKNHVRSLSIQVPSPFGLPCSLTSCSVPDEDDHKHLRACNIFATAHAADELTAASVRLPKKPTSMPMLRYLRFVNTGSPVSAVLRQAPALQFLKLHGCTGVTERTCLAELCQPLVPLQHLSISGTGSMSLPESIGNCGQLHHIDLKGCVALTHLPESIGNCSQLQHLDLRECRSLTHLPESIGNCGQLQYLDLRWCHALTHLPESIGKCSQLQHLDIRGCRVLTHLPESIGDCSLLQQLYLKNCRSLTHLPESIGDCSQLQHLDLSECHALTYLPESIGDCSQLQHLHLRWCRDLTHLPESISKCIQLQHLNLESCDMLTKLPNNIGNCSQLQHLDLSECDALTDLPESIGDCSQVQHLDLRWCRVLTHLPESIGDCSQLQHLHLRRCRDLTHLPESIIKCIQLQHLNLESCDMLTKLPNNIGNCSQLQHLDLSECDALTDLPESTGECSQLQHLDLGCCRALTHLPESIGDCSQLQYLDISGCHALTHLPESTGKCSQLQHLDLRWCRSLTHLPESICNCSQLHRLILESCGMLTKLPNNIGDCSQLQHLDLRGCFVLTHLPESIGNCSKLKHLDTSACHVLTHLPQSIGDCSQLQHLDLSVCRVLTQPLGSQLQDIIQESCDMPKNISDCTQLQHHNLTGCRVLTHLPESIGNCSQLQYLDLRGCHVLTHLPQSIGNCSQLQHLDLSVCRVLTHLPESIGDCRQLQHLDLSVCRSLTHLPESIGSCSQLQLLHLRGCCVLTHLPERIGDCSQLQHLDLGGCCVLTHLPESIGDCSQLQHLDLKGCCVLTHLPERIGDCSLLQHLDLRGCRVLTHLPESIGNCSQLHHLDLESYDMLTHLPKGIDHCSQTLASLGVML